MIGFDSNLSKPSKVSSGDSVFDGWELKFLTAKYQNDWRFKLKKNDCSNVKLSKPSDVASDDSVFDSLLVETNTGLERRFLFLLAVSWNQHTSFNMISLDSRCSKSAHFSLDDSVLGCSHMKLRLRRYGDETHTSCSVTNPWRRPISRDFSRCLVRDVLASATAGQPTVLRRCRGSRLAKTELAQEPSGERKREYWDFKIPCDTGGHHKNYTKQPPQGQL